MVSPPSPHTKPDRAYHHGDLRNALIDAGLTALEAQDASELSLRALAGERFRRVAREQREARAQLDTDPAATGLGYIRFAQRHPALFRLMFGRFTRACDNAELQEAALAAFGQLLEDSRASGPAGQAQPNPGAIDEATMLRAIARWSLVHGLSHLMLEGQLSFFGPGAASEQLAQAVLMASGMGSAPQPLGKPSTNASS